MVTLSHGKSVITCAALLLWPFWIAELFEIVVSEKKCCGLILITFALDLSMVLQRFRAPMVRRLMQ